MNSKKNMKNRIFVKQLVLGDKAITLVALVVTIIVLLILAGVTITMVFSENGILSQAQRAASKTDATTTLEEIQMKLLAVQMENDGSYTNEDVIDVIEAVTGNDVAEWDDEVATQNGNTITISNFWIGTKPVYLIQTSNVAMEDEFGNKVIIPKGFRVVFSGEYNVEYSSSETGSPNVPDGVVIADAVGNQFVWIPVGTVYKDNTGTNTSTITLGRYTFDSSDGTPTLQQNATNYTEKVTINSYYIEYSYYRAGTFLASKSATNATAYNLQGFIESALNNGGYYIARYEASYGSGSTTSDRKPLSQESTGYSTSSMSYTEGTLWNFITQLDASKVCINMYKDDETVGVESDLANSYAWDTAIVFIQEMGNDNYANQTRVKSVLANSGTTGDVACNIYDMASNLYEWTTEYSSKVENNAQAYVARGGSHWSR